MDIQGEGELYEGNKKITRVRYNLSIEHDKLVADDFQGHTEIEGVRGGMGILSDINDTSINLYTLLHQTRTLHMDNGKKQDCIVTDVDRNRREITILLTGDFY